MALIASTKEGSSYVHQLLLSLQSKSAAKGLLWVHGGPGWIDVHDKLYKFVHAVQ